MHRFTGSRVEIATGMKKGLREVPTFFAAAEATLAPLGCPNSSVCQGAGHLHQLRHGELRTPPPGLHPGSPGSPGLLEEFSISNTTWWFN